MATKYFNTVEDNETGKPVAAATVKVYIDGAVIDGTGSQVTSGTLATIFSDDGATVIDQASSPLTADSFGYFEFYTNETEVALEISYGGAAKKAISDVSIIGGTVNSDVTALALRVDNHDTLFGTAANATDLGTFTGTTITDNVTVKTALQELETATEAASDGFDVSAAYTVTGRWNHQNGVVAMSVGADNGAITLTDATQKLGRLGGPHYTNAEEPVAWIVGTSSSSANQINIGGGTSSFNAVTDIKFYTGATTTTTTGTERVRIDGSGNLLASNASVNVLTESIVVSCSGESAPISTTGTKRTFRMPFPMTLTGVRASVNSACSTGTFTVDINEGGTTILSTKLTIDATEKTSTTAATAAVISDSVLADDAEITIDVDNVGDSTASGLKVTLIGLRT